MKLVRNLLLAACTLAAAATALAGEAEIRKNLPARIPQFPTIDEVTKSPLPGLYEAVSYTHLTLPTIYSV